MPLQAKDLVVRQIAPGDAWLRVEEDLLRSGVALPLYHRAAWAESQSAASYSLLAVEAADGGYRGAAAVQRYKSRTLPGHSHLRVMRFGEGMPAAAWQPLAAELARLARGDRSVLRLTVNVFSKESRGQLATILEEEGFSKSTNPQSYRHTLIVDLSGSVDALLARLDKKARRDLREAEKAEVHVKTLVTGEYASRLNALELEAMHRTGGSFQMQNWPAILQLSQEHPGLSRVVGLFPSGEQTRPEDMMAFSWGCMHGSHGEYRSAGTTRLPSSRLTLSSPVLWDLILWSKSEGAMWFDLGGVTLAADVGEDPMSSISSYKRRFSTLTAEVGEDWVLEPHPTRTRTADLLGKGAQGLGRLAKAVRRRKELHAE